MPRATFLKAFMDTTFLPPPPGTEAPRPHLRPRQLHRIVIEMITALPHRLHRKPTSSHKVISIIIVIEILIIGTLTRTQPLRAVEEVKGFPPRLIHIIGSSCIGITTTNAVIARLP